MIGRHEIATLFMGEIGREYRADEGPADFQTAVKLLHYSKRAGTDSSEVFVQLEKARASGAMIGRLW